MTQMTNPVLGIDQRVHTESRQNAMEIIGLNGEPLVECGTSLPVLKYTEDGFFHVPVIKGLPIHHHPDELAGFVQNKSITMFNATIPFPTSAERPRVVFANKAFIDLAEQGLPEHSEDWPCAWVTVKDQGVQMFATCASENVAKKWLDACAKIILEKFDQTITSAEHESGIDRESLHRYADIALCAATNRSLRFRLWVRYCAMMKPEKVRRMFDTLFNKEFTRCPWENFQERVNRFVEQLRIHPAGIAQP
ncbi:MAG: hypothetical protein K8Q97_03750 [Candidatus Andersenbacteria bacterium]|nr:hypothetical protein [Candidatus Andersenbacteria bacterium]